MSVGNFLGVLNVAVASKHMFSLVSPWDMDDLPIHCCKRKPSANGVFPQLCKSHIMSCIQQICTSVTRGWHLVSKVGEVSSAKLLTQSCSKPCRTFTAIALFNQIPRPTHTQNKFHLQIILFIYLLKNFTVSLHISFTSSFSLKLWG